MFPTAELFRESKVMDIKQLYHNKILLHYYRHKEKISKLPEHSYETRSKGKHIKPKMTKTIGQRSYSYIAPTLYNELPEEIKIIKSQQKFKAILRKYMLNDKFK